MPEAAAPRPIAQPRISLYLRKASAMPPSFVSILIPALNEERHIAAAIRSVAPGDAGLDYEIIVLDGGSTDRTPQIVAELSRTDSRIRLVPNPRRLQSAALNLGAEVADKRAEILVRADSHAAYKPGFVAALVGALHENQAQSVVVTMVTEGVSWFQRGAAAAQNSVLGNGGSAHRRPGSPRFVDHGHHAAFDRAFFRAIGGYDESMVANEDVDLDMRIARAGGRIWLETAVPVTYFPRDTAAGLARQYFRYGYGRFVTWRRYGYRLKLRQLLPVAILAGNVLVLAGALVVSPLLLVLPLAYASLCCLWGIGRSLAMGPAAMIMHHAWGAGFLSGLLRRGDPTSANPPA
jgi:succinoglycan biosynthesis protein ExoA